MFPEKPEPRPLRKRHRAFRVEALEPRELLTFTVIHRSPSFSPAVLQAIQAADVANTAQARALPVAISTAGKPTAGELARRRPSDETTTASRTPGTSVTRFASKNSKLWIDVTVMTVRPAREYPHVAGPPRIARRARRPPPVGAEAAPSVFPRVRDRE